LIYLLTLLIERRDTSIPQETDSFIKD